MPSQTSSRKPACPAERSPSAQALAHNLRGPPQPRGRDVLRQRLVRQEGLRTCPRPREAGPGLPRPPREGQA
eukprot:4737435-Alexandrium_andersonii.AAC.1